MIIESCTEVDNEDQGVFLDGEYNLYQAHALHDFDPFLGFKIVSNLPLSEEGQRITDN